MGIATTFDCAAIREGVFFDGDGRERTVRSSRPAFYLVRRGSGSGTLDQALKAQALAAGVRIRFGQAPPVEREDAIRTPGPEPLRRARRRLRVPHGHGGRSLRGALGAARAQGLRLPARLARLGHGGGVPLRRLRAARATTASSRGSSSSAGPGCACASARAFAGTGTLRHTAVPRVGRTLYAGEAAGLQDALWGFGMRFALVSGHMAARALIERSPHNYDRSLRARFDGLLRASVVNRYFYERLGRFGIRAAAARASGAPATSETGCGASTPRGCGRRCGFRSPARRSKRRGGAPRPRSASRPRPRPSDRRRASCRRHRTSNTTSPRARRSATSSSGCPTA